jgi:hypothetical protein
MKAIDLAQSAAALLVRSLADLARPSGGRMMDWTILTLLPAFMVLGLAFIASRA